MYTQWAEGLRSDAQGAVFGFLDVMLSQDQRLILLALAHYRPNFFLGAMSKAVLQQVEAAVKAKGADLVKQAGAVFQLVVGDNKLHLDLKNGAGATKWGEDKADVTITLADADFVAMAEGKLDGMQAFMAGKLKIKGNMMLAQKLGPILESARK